MGLKRKIRDAETDLLKIEIRGLPSIIWGFLQPFPLQPIHFAIDGSTSLPISDILKSKLSFPHGTTR
jgi:hypothetical protein